MIFPVNFGLENIKQTLSNLMKTVSGPWWSFRESSETSSGPEVGLRHQVAHREEHVDHGRLVGSHLLWSVPLILRPQLRFERHPSVHKLYLNMWGERNPSFCQPSSYQIKPPPNLPSLQKSTRPTLVFVCTHASLSYLNCEFQLSFSYFSFRSRILRFWWLDQEWRMEIQKV